MMETLDLQLTVTVNARKPEPSKDSQATDVAEKVSGSIANPEKTVGEMDTS